MRFDARVYRARTLRDVPCGLPTLPPLSCSRRVETLVILRKFYLRKHSCIIQEQWLVSVSCRYVFAE
jgi:hypothetical protein